MPESESSLVRWIEEERRKEELKHLSSEDDSDPYSLSSPEDKGLEGSLHSKTWIVCLKCTLNSGLM